MPGAPRRGGVVLDLPSDLADDGYVPMEHEIKVRVPDPSAAPEAALPS